MRDVTHIVEEGKLPASALVGTGIQLKIGASPIASKDKVLLTGTSSISAIRSKLGYSPLGDAVMDAIENGASKIYCMPLVPEIAGDITEEAGKHTAGSASVTLSGTPTNAFTILAELTGQGGVNVATFRYSINGGYSYSDDLTIPLSGSYTIEEAGVTLGFETGEGKEYVLGDWFQWNTTEPQLRTQQILEAVEGLANFKTEMEYVHVVGACDADVWSSIAGLQLQLEENHHKPLMFILEAYRPEPDEDIYDYLNRLLADRKKVNNHNIQVCASRMMYKGMDSLWRDINAANIVTGLYSKTAVNRSIGETAVISIGEDRISALLPDGMADDIISELDEAGYLTFRQYDGLEGYYVTNANMMCLAGSNYQYAENTRVLNKIIRVSRKSELLQLQSDIDMSEVESELKKKALFVQADLEDMIKAKEISSVTVVPAEEQDILATEELVLMIRYVERGKIRSIVTYVGVTNPYAE